MELVLIRVLCLKAATEIKKSWTITVGQHQRSVSIDTLDETKVRRCPEGQLNAFSFEQIQKMVIFHRHAVGTRLGRRMEVYVYGF